MINIGKVNDWVVIINKKTIMILASKKKEKLVFWMSWEYKINIATLYFSFPQRRLFIVENQWEVGVVGEGGKEGDGDFIKSTKAPVTSYLSHT